MRSVYPEPILPTTTPFTQPSPYHITTAKVFVLDKFDDTRESTPRSVQHIWVFTWLLTCICPWQMKRICICAFVPDQFSKQLVLISESPTVWLYFTWISLVHTEHQSHGFWHRKNSIGWKGNPCAETDKFYSPCIPKNSTYTCTIFHEKFQHWTSRKVSSDTGIWSKIGRVSEATRAQRIDLRDQSGQNLALDWFLRLQLTESRHPTWPWIPAFKEITLCQCG